MTVGIISIIACFLYLWKIAGETIKRSRYDWFPLVWLIIPLIETQVEPILKFFKRLDLGWNTLIKPLEGFRFYGFLAQPLALIIGWVIVKYLIVKVKRAGLVCFVTASILLIALTFDLQHVFGIRGRFQNPGINVAEYQAAVWFRNHSSDKSRIIADYYRSQMFAGVCGGKALLGGLFPLRNVKIPYVSIPAVAQEDICTIYTTPDPKLAYDLMRKYGCDSVYISTPLIGEGNIGSTQCQGFGIKIELQKFENQQYFIESYKDNQGTRIMKIREDPNPKVMK
jgi:hypothetical protein